MRELDVYKLFMGTTFNVILWMEKTLKWPSYILFIIDIDVILHGFFFVHNGIRNIGLPSPFLCVAASEFSMQNFIRPQL